ncbi:MAG TPA: septation regulator SpoVG [Acholeplasmataceae bacterium]|jgi:stage V sporulation protein G|nr:septation regulator SpoVG [Acholeplasmataceae bacterium]HPX71521.1 septation regulator SpoVG [Acholeplasmataceae bacterium]
MKITDVRVRVIGSESRLKGVATITFNNSFVVHDIKIIEGESGVFIAMPSKKMPNGSYRDIAHPINSETRKLLEDAIIAEYENVLANPEANVEDDE